MLSAGESPNPNGAYPTVVHIQVNTSKRIWSSPDISLESPNPLGDPLFYNFLFRYLSAWSVYNDSFDHQSRLFHQNAFLFLNSTATHTINMQEPLKNTYAFSTRPEARMTFKDDASKNAYGARQKQSPAALTRFFSLFNPELEWQGNADDTALGFSSYESWLFWGKF